MNKIILNDTKEIENNKWIGEISYKQISDLIKNEQLFIKCKEVQKNGATAIAFPNAKDTQNDKIIFSTNSVSMTKNNELEISNGLYIEEGYGKLLDIVQSVQNNITDIHKLVEYTIIKKEI